MTLKDHLDKAVNDVKDSANEALHRSAADAEKTRRELDGDNMTSTEKLESMASEAKHRTEAEVDSAKRSIRDHT